MRPISIAMLLAVVAPVAEGALSVNVRNPNPIYFGNVVDLTFPMSIVALDPDNVDERLQSYTVTLNLTRDDGSAIRFVPNVIMSRISSGYPYVFDGTPGATLELASATDTRLVFEGSAPTGQQANITDISSGLAEIFVLVPQNERGRATISLDVNGTSLTGAGGPISFEPGSVGSLEFVLIPEPSTAVLVAWLSPTLLLRRRPRREA
jgi:hypothetical protein